MKSLRNVAACAIACALCSAAPTRGDGPKAKPSPADPRESVVKSYFADPLPAAPNARPGDPKWVESMQRLLKDLTDDNTKLRSQNQALRADNEALRRQLEQYEAAARRARENRGAAVVPPNLLVTPPGAQGNQVPPNWRPFEFNGATYYLVPLEHRAADRASPSVEPKGGTITLPEASK